MNRQPPHRFSIWNLAEPGQNERKPPKAGPATPAAGAASAAVRPATRAPADRFARQELLYADLSSPSRARTGLDDSAMLNTLYDHRLPIDIELPGRCLMPNGRSTTCKTRKISSESVELIYDVQTAGYPIRPPEEIPAGSTIHLDLDQIGNVHGVLTAQNSEGFRLAVDVNCKGMLITKLAQMAAARRGGNYDMPGPAVPASVTRIEPNLKACSFTDNTGTLRKGKIINISQIDALIKAPIIPAVGTQIVFGGPQHYEAEVTRSFEIGFAVKFCAPIPAEEFSSAIKFLDV
ncbi:MAG: hypothetical protein ACYC5H_17065 [Methylovirgula sp.]